MTQHLAAVIWTMSALVMPLATAVAQPRTGQVSGTVVDLTSGAVVANADIVHMGSGRKVVSDAAGKYVFPDVPPGFVRFLVRGSGFPVTVIAVALVGGESLARVIVLDSTETGRASAQALPSMGVVAAASPPPRYADFERRRQNGRGQYLVREDIMKAGFASLQDAMRGLRGVNIDCGGGLGCSIRMSRAPMRCTPEYIVDERVDNHFGPATPIGDIEGIEVYTGPSDVPGEFAGRNAGCGVIVIWTRAGPPRPRR